MRLGTQHFVGREQELAALLSALDVAASGRGQWALLSGEAGIGKTSLADMLAQRARERDVDVLWAVCGDGDHLRAELESAVSLRGVVRRWDAPAERARLSVTKAIRSSEQKIAAACPELGQHLANCIKTGQTCSYEPERGREIVWQ